MTKLAHHVEFQPTAWAGFEADYDGDYGGAVEGGRRVGYAGAGAGTENVT